MKSQEMEDDLYMYKIISVLIFDYKDSDDGVDDFIYVYLPKIGRRIGGEGIA